MRSKSATYYEGRVAFGPVALLPALALPAYAAFLWYHWGTTPLRPGPELLAMILELGLPLAAAASAAPLMAVEREERFDELRASYPQPPWRLPLVRTLGALALSGASLLATAALLRQGYGPFDWSQVVVPALAPTLFLLGFTLLASGVLGNYWAAAGTGFGYWLLEALTRGSLTHDIFLFDHHWPVENDVYARNRWLLAGLGVVLLLVNIWWNGRRRKGGTG